MYTQNFDTGSATYTSDPYWGPTVNSNGYICTSTNTIGCAGGVFGTELTADETNPGTGFFLFEGTGGSSTCEPRARTIFFESPSFHWWRSILRTIPLRSFLLTNANTSAAGEQHASVQADINDGLLGSPISAAGFYSDGTPAGQWQQFTFTWSSGTHTTAQLILRDLTATTLGNDFGIDGISVSSTGATAPEPGTFVLFGAGALAGLAWFRRKAAVRRSPPFSSSDRVLQITTPRVRSSRAMRARRCSADNWSVTVSACSNIRTSALR